MEKEGWVGEGRIGWRRKDRLEKEGWVREGRIGWRGKDGLEKKGWVGEGIIKFSGTKTILNFFLNVSTFKEKSALQRFKFAFTSVLNTS